MTGTSLVLEPAAIDFWRSWISLAMLLSTPLAGVAAWALAQGRRDGEGGPAARGTGVPAPASLAAWVKGLVGWQRLLTAFAAGTLSVLAMPPFFLSPVLFLALPLLVWLIDGAAPPGAVDRRGTALRAAVAGWWFGFGYFLAGLYWIGEAFLVEAEVFAWLLPFAVTLMPAGLALFFALAAALARLAWSGGLSRVLVLAVALSAFEWLRGHILTGFPWNTLGYALTYPLPLMQAAGVLGIYGLTLATVPIFAAPLVMLAEIGAPPRRSGLPTALAAATAVVPLAALWTAGSIALQRQPLSIDDSVRLRIVQPSVPQREKWQGDKQGAIFALHLDLSRQAPDGRRDDLAGITHVVWPEAAMPFLPLERPEALSAIAGLLAAQTYLVTGALRVQRPPQGAQQLPRIFNSLLVFGPGGGLTALYDKIHLVPFGEYLPLQPILESIGLQQLTRQRGGFSSGAIPRPLLAVPGLPAAAPLVCYEAIFPSELIQGAERPGLLVNVTNDGWFGDTTGPHQHLHQSRVRAVEQGLPLIRAANNGISAVVDAQGRVLARLELNRRGTLDSGLPRAAPPTLYARYGDGIFLLMMAAALAGIMLVRWRSSAHG